MGYTILRIFYYLILLLNKDEYEHCYHNNNLFIIAFCISF